jgi:hypothetical protein
VAAGRRGGAVEKKELGGESVPVLEMRREELSEG